MQEEAETQIQDIVEFLTGASTALSKLVEEYAEASKGEDQLEARRKLKEIQRLGHEIAHVAKRGSGDNTLNRWGMGITSIWGGYARWNWRFLKNGIDWEKYCPLSQGVLFQAEGTDFLVPYSDSLADNFCQLSGISERGQDFILVDGHMGTALYEDRSSLAVQSCNPPSYIIAVNVISARGAIADEQDFYHGGEGDAIGIKTYRFSYDWNGRSMYIDSGSQDM